MRVDASRPAIPSPWPQTPHTFSPHAIHLIRTSVQTNLSLSQMADQKASILMGATFVVFTIAVGQARGGNVSLPLMVLALFAFLSAMCAVFAILPSVRGTPKPKADVPPGATVVGNPGHPVRVEGKRVEGPDADWIHLPDPIADAIKALSERIGDLERRLAELDGGESGGGDGPEIRPRTGRSSAGG